MEGASIAQAATLNNIPYVVIRAISDKADGSAQEDYPTFEKKAAEHCAKVSTGNDERTVRIFGLGKNCEKPVFCPNANQSNSIDGILGKS